MESGCCLNTYLIAQHSEMLFDIKVITGNEMDFFFCEFKPKITKAGFSTGGKGLGENLKFSIYFFLYNMIGK